MSALPEALRSLAPAPAGKLAVDQRRA